MQKIEQIINKITGLLISILIKFKGWISCFFSLSIGFIKKYPKRVIAGLILLFIAYKAVSYFLPKDDAKKAPIQTVSTATVEQKDFPVIIESTGNTVASSIVDIRPQTTNVVAKIHIKEGQEVKQGDLLFTLDDRASRANYEKAKALADDAQRQAKRARELLAQNFISQASYDTTIANTQSAVASAKAAEVAMSFDHIRSPISGKAGVINVFPGSLVASGNVVTTSTSATGTSSVGSMVTIAKLDPINVQFTIPEKNLTGLTLEQKNSGGITVEVQTTNGQKKKGKVFVIDNQVDPSIGAVRVKAEIENSDYALIPGQFVQVQLNSSTIKDALIVPSQAIVSNTKGDQIYVVDAEDKVTLKPVKVSAMVSGKAAVTGVNAGDRIVVEGKQNLRPGGKIREAKPTSAETKKN
jgi:RND family efflux transporter MFP subunit